MKTASRVPIKKTSSTKATKAVKTVSARPVTRTIKRGGSLSRAARATKRYGKQTLREILLSKTFHSAFKLSVGLLIVGSALYGAYAFIGTTVANDVVVSKSEIIARVGKHVQLPGEDPEAVVRVQDADTLRTQAALYENVKEGDYILVYQSMAVVYDLRNDRIVAMKSAR